MKYGRQNKLSVLVLDDQGHHTHAVITCLGEIPGLQIHALSNYRWTAVRFSRFCKSFRLVNGQPAGNLLFDQVRKEILRTKAQVFLPIVESGIRFAIARKSELEKIIRLPPLPELEALNIVSDKYSLAQFLTAHSLPTPETRLVPPPAEIEKGQFSFPLLAKPMRGSGGSGILRFENREVLLHHLEKFPGLRATHMLQSYIPGDELGCSFLAQNGRILAHTIQKDFREKDRFHPTNCMEFIQHEATLEAIEKLVAALNWSGIAHVDLRVDESGQPFIIDFNPRYWLSLLGSLAAGVNFPHLSCLTALGRKFPTPEYNGVHYLSSERVLKHLARGSFQTVTSRHSKSGFRYLFADPMPRAINLARKISGVL